MSSAAPVYGLRPYTARNGLALGIAVIAGSFVVDQPLVLALTFAFWIVLAQNAFGFDVPLDGTTRHLVLPTSTARLLHRRELAIVLVFTVPFAVALVAAAYALIVNVATRTWPAALALRLALTTLLLLALYGVTVWWEWRRARTVGGADVPSLLRTT